jgi:fluoride exporter
VREILAVSIGGALGTLLRYSLGGWLAERWGPSFPWHTFAVNVGGAFLLGLLMALSVDRGLLGPAWRLFAGVGVLGGFTTFSTLSYESVALMERGLTIAGLGNMFGSAVAGIVAVIAGLIVGRMI